MVKTLSRVVYKAHIKYQDYCDKIEVHRKLVTFSDDISVL